MVITATDTDITKEYKIRQSISVGRFYIIELENHKGIKAVGIARRSQGDKNSSERSTSIATGRAIKGIKLKEEEKKINHPLIGQVNMTKANCYECKYRGTIPGDCHSRCNYPGVKSDLFDFFSYENQKIAAKLNIQGDSHGFRSGWFMWPCNFDPVWLINCDGFEQKEKPCPK